MAPPEECAAPATPLAPLRKPARRNPATRANSQCAASRTRDGSSMKPRAPDHPRSSSTNRRHSRSPGGRPATERSNTCPLAWSIGPCALRLSPGLLRLGENQRGRFQRHESLTRTQRLIEPARLERNIRQRSNGRGQRLHAPVAVLVMRVTGQAGAIVRPPGSRRKSGSSGALTSLLPSSFRIRSPVS